MGTTLKRIIPDNGSNTDFDTGLTAANKINYNSDLIEKKLDSIESGSGVPGDDGRGIINIVRTSGTGEAGTIDTYTIYYTDATTSTFSVKNGANGITPVVGQNGNWHLGAVDTGNKAIGVDGRGIINIQRTSGTGGPGSIDVYTIYYTDNTTDTFTVTNGEDLGFVPEQAGVATQLISELKDDVPTEGDTLNKLYDLIISQFSEVQVGTIEERDAYNITKLPTNVFVLNDGDSKWALYKATTIGINATYVKLSDPDLLNAVMSASQIAASYESVDDVNRFTDALKAKLDSITAIFTTELKATYDGKISPKPALGTPPYTVGQHVAGGVVFYILQPTDHGYEAGKQTNLIVSLEDRSAGLQWSPDYAVTGQTATDIGYGLSNTLGILDVHISTQWYAAKICSYTPDAGFSDWYLGSLNEMLKLYENRAITGLSNLNNTYWTSSESDEQYAYVVYNDGEINSQQKNQAYAVRAIRTSVLDLGYSLPVDGEIIVASGNDAKEVKGSGLSIQQLIIQSRIYQKSATDNSTNGVYNLDAGVTEGKSEFLIPVDMDLDHDYTIFDGGVMVKPTIDTVTRIATFSSVPLNENEITYKYYPIQN